uniref:Zinc finger SWIM domain-containing protein 7-like n=1 Tax=Crassostrea virginica TaxID=6565 RepID=A0A8B8E4D1_CRAVI|nr:zinc finger SWIM domain-containing protein 7-like [Crassostrea virginica]
MAKMSPARQTIITVAEQLLEDAGTAYTTTGAVSDEILSALNFVFKAPLLPALVIVDHRDVTTITCPSGRKIHQVVGSSGTPYICLPSSYYCSCPSYRYSVLLRDEHLMCKHVIAMKLAVGMGVSKQQEVTDQEMTTLLKSLE